MFSEEECDAAGGSWFPEWNLCDPNPCEATPSNGITWGLIKQLYRE